MADYFDNDTLITEGTGDVTLTLTCGYGQPIATTVHVKDASGITTEIAAFAGECTNKVLGSNQTLKYKRIIVFSIVHDIQDVASGDPVEDINIGMAMSCNGTSVDTRFIKETKGKGSLVKCTYEIILL